MRPDRRSRRGANAVEFAIILPFLLMILLGTVEYGWFFFQQSQAFHAVSAAARDAAMEVPDVADGAGTGTCTPCVDMAETSGVNRLANVGIDAVAGDLNASVGLKDGHCAVMMSPSIPYVQLTGFVPTPASFSLDVSALAFNVNGC